MSRRTDVFLSTALLPTPVPAPFPVIGLIGLAGGVAMSGPNATNADGLLDGSIPTPASSVLAGVWPIQGVVVTPGNQIALTNTAKFRLL